MLEYQQFIKCLINKHNQILEKGLVEESWDRYQGKYHKKTMGIRKYMSEENVNFENANLNNASE